jgi:Putative Zn-dependent protease, contains TPR repeats
MKIRPATLQLSIFLFCLTIIIIAQATAAFAQDELRYNYDYSCNKERIVIGHCRKDSDQPGFAPTVPEDDYCQVYYPDRPKRGGFEAMGTVLRGEIIKTLSACGALRQEAEPVSQASDGDGDDSNAEFKTGKEYYDNKDYARAAEHLKKAADIDHSSFVAYLYLGMSYYNLKQYPEAIDAIKVTVRLVPAMPEAHYWLGVAYVGTSQYTTAESELREAIRLNADYQGAYEWLGVTLSKDKKYPDAIKAFQQALRLKPDDETVIYSMGLTYARMGQKENAMQVYNKLSTLDKKLAQDILDEINEPRATKTAVPSKSTGPNAPNLTSSEAAALVEQARKYFDAKAYAKAIETCKKAILTYPKNAELHFYLALSYDQSEQWESAVKAWNNYIPLVKPFPGEFVLLGDANRNLKHYEEALKAYQKALDLKPDAKKASGINYWIGVSYDAMEQYANAIPPLLESIRLDPNYGYARSQLGYSYMFLGQTDKAIASFKEAIRLKPGDANAHYYLGLAYSVNGKKAEAMQEYKTLQTLDKKSAQELLTEINKP